MKFIYYVILIIFFGVSFFSIQNLILEKNVWNIENQSISSNSEEYVVCGNYTLEKKYFVNCSYYNDEEIIRQETIEMICKTGWVPEIFGEVDNEGNLVNLTAYTCIPKCETVLGECRQEPCEGEECGLLCYYMRIQNKGCSVGESCAFTEELEGKYLEDYLAREGACHEDIVRDFMQDKYLQNKICAEGFSFVTQEDASYTCANNPEAW